MDEFINVAGIPYKIRFPGIIRIDIERNAATFLNVPNRKIDLGELVQQLRYTEVQAYLLMQGIRGGEKEKRKFSYDDALELLDTYLAEGDMDVGEKIQALTTTLMMASVAASGMDGKKLIGKIANDQKKADEDKLTQIYAAQLRAKALVESELAGTGERPMILPSENLDLPLISSGN